MDKGHVSSVAEADGWVDLAWISQYAGISLTELNRRKALNKLPPHADLGRRLHRWRRIDIERWLASHVVRREAAE